MVPEHGLGVLATAGAERAVRGHGDSVEVASVTNVVGLQLAVGQVPHLDVLVPTSGHNDGVLVVGAEPNTADPVSVSILLDGVLALSQGVPQLDGLVPGSGDNLPIVCRESHGEHVLSVVLEPPGSLASAQVPQARGLVPGAGQGEVTVGREDHVRDEVTMSVQALLRDAIVASVIPSQLPDNERLVPGAGEDHVGVLGVGRDLGDPAIVAAEGSAKLQRLSHVAVLLLFSCRSESSNNSL